MATAREEAQANLEWLQTAAWHVEASIPSYNWLVKEIRETQLKLENLTALLDHFDEEDRA